VISELDSLLKERETASVQCQFKISKSTDTIISRFAEKHYLEYDIALELLVSIAAIDNDIWEEDYLKKLSDNWVKKDQ
jgi:hypothetical protein